ncbi:MAG: NAD(+)/NADH kinase [Bdellovibrionaceae bacterium]|nr:NAD(+)/NADH kinase [Pseudobdellovibrionaceae bacterium]
MKATKKKTSKKVLVKKGRGQTVALVYRLQTPEAVKSARELAAWLASRGHKAFTAPEQKELPEAPLIKSKDFDKTDLVVVLGGDGTYLRAVRLLNDRPIPILGFNMGSLGFLTVHPVNRLIELTEKTLAGKMVSQPRTMIQAIVRRNGRKHADFRALNDVVLERGSYSHLINAAIYLGNQRISEVKADGFIVSSPTGSTAYNLAAGGPILDPCTRAFSLTPVAPHALTTRPLVLPDDVEIIFRLVPGRDQKAHFIIDGQKQLEVMNGDEVILRKSASDHLVVREPDFNFFTLLRDKLKFGDRA